jgi:hypothetical protein
MDKQADVLKAKLNLETAQVAWTSLQRFFAQGSVIWVHRSLDLIEVAHQIAEDDSKVIKQWMTDKKLAKVSDTQAKHWLQADAWLWSVVVRPLVLVQELTDGEKDL